MHEPTEDRCERCAQEYHEHCTGCGRCGCTFSALWQHADSVRLREAARHASRAEGPP